MKIRYKYKKLKKVPYLYIFISFKDSYVRDGHIVTSINDESCKSAINQIVNDISRLTSRAKLPFLYSIGSGSVAAQGRIIIRCPYGWSIPRFKEVARLVCEKSPACDLVIECEVRWSVDMDTGYLGNSWKGRGKS